MITYCQSSKCDYGQKSSYWWRNWNASEKSVYLCSYTEDDQAHLGIQGAVLEGVSEWRQSRKDFLEIRISDGSIRKQAHFGDLTADQRAVLQRRRFSKKKASAIFKIIENTRQQIRQKRHIRQRIVWSSRRLSKRVLCMAKSVHCTRRVRGKWSQRFWDYPWSLQGTRV